MIASAAAPKRLPVPCEPYHVLFVFDQLRNLDGGAERSLLRISQLLPPERFRATIITFHQPPDSNFLRQFGCPVKVLPLNNTLGWKSISAAIKLKQFIQSEKVSIVQTFFASADLWGATVAKLSGCPIIISSRRDMGFQRTLKHRIAYRLLSPLYDCVHTVSDAVRNFTIQRDHIQPAKVVTIRNGVEILNPASPHDLHSFRVRFGLEGLSPLIVDVGSVKAVKGYEVLARTAEIVCRR